MRSHFTDKIEITEQIEINRRRLKECRRIAEENVRDMGWSEQDEDFWIQVEEEEKRLWMQDQDIEKEEELFNGIF